MQVQWFIRVARALFMVLSTYMGSVIAQGFGAGRFTGGAVGMILGGLVVLLDASMGKFSVRHFSHAVFGLFAGLLSAFVVSRFGVLQLGWISSLQDAENIKNAIELVVYATLGFLGVTLSVRSDRDQFALLIPYVRFRRDSSEGEPMLLDTNIVIDGRIPRLIQTGFLSGTLVIPRLVLDELQRLADSHDSIKADRGRRGLHVLEEMRAMRDLDLTIHEDGTRDTVAVDARLVSLARELNARLLTNDENLAQVARLRGIQVLSLNELSRALQTELAAGDELEVALVKPGREKHQAVGYMPDGAMIVVNQAFARIGQTVRVMITGTTQTAAGRLVFADVKAAG
jgi:uncharacterized protein YacL